MVEGLHDIDEGTRMHTVSTVFEGVVLATIAANLTLLVYLRGFTFTLVDLILMFKIRYVSLVCT